MWSFVNPSVLLGALAVTAAAAPVRIPVTADTSICAHPSEQDLNAGHAARLKLKGTENLILLSFDPAALRGRPVLRATLRFTATEANPMIRWVGLSTVATDWREGTGGYTPDGDGATFRSPGTGKSSRWGGEGSTFLDAVFGRGGTLWTRTIAARREGNFREIPVNPRLLHAVAAGLSAGLVLADDNGQTMHLTPDLVPGSNRSNNYFFSREQAGKGPVLLVEFGAPPPPPTSPPAGVTVSVAPAADAATAGGGGVEIAWDAVPVGSPGVTVRLGYPGRNLAPLPRWMLPGADGARRLRVANVPAGAQVEAEIEVMGTDGTVAHGRGAGFASGRIDLPMPLARPAASPAPPAAQPSTGPSIRIVPDLVRINPVSGSPLEPSVRPIPTRDGVTLAALRGEWVAFQVVCDKPVDGPREWTIAIPPLTGPGGAINARLLRLAYVRIGDGLTESWGDPLVPLGPAGAFRIPAEADGVPGQSNQTIYAEFFIPMGAKPGRYTGAVTVTAGGRPLPAVPVRVEVAPAALPVAAAFTFSLNTYDTPGGEAERALYALAHDHRATLAVLHYSHSGNYAEGCVPPVTGTGAAARVADWTAFDARFGPLFDGTAFAGTSRAGIGLDHFYLALSEHYPVPMATGYRWNNVRWEDHWKTAGTIQQGFSPAMQEAWIAVAKEYAEHIRAKGWNTKYQVYLNDKYFYKQADPKTKRPGAGVSFWLLDEPMHVDDFLALNFFGGLLRRATGGARTPIVFRADISRPEWGRDLLDDVVNLNVSGGWPEHAALLDGFKAGFGQSIWTYGDTPSAATSSLAIPAQALDLYAHGIDGYVPWQVIGDAGNWTTAATTAVILPGAPRGIFGPVATLRLKAYRRAEQDVEYLKLYAAKSGWTEGDPRRLRLAAWLRDVLPMRIRTGSLDAQGAAVFSYGSVTPDSLDFLRSEIRKAL